MLLGYKESPSEYELKNIVWAGIEYDKEKLIKFVKRYEKLRYSSTNSTEVGELSIMEEILNTHNKKNLQKLLQNDPSYSRWACIERLARQASTEILIDGKYSKDTFSTISNLPISDYKLVIRRSKELIKIINETIAEAEMDTSKIPGVK